MKYSFDSHLLECVDYMTDLIQLENVGWIKSQQELLHLAKLTLLLYHTLIFLYQKMNDLIELYSEFYQHPLLILNRQ